MKKRYRRNQKLEIYADYHNQNKSYGKVKLIEYLRPGETFTKDSDKDENGELVIYCYERWIVEFIDSKYYKKGHKKQHNIRFKLSDITDDKSFISSYPSEKPLEVSDEDEKFDGF